MKNIFRASNGIINMDFVTLIEAPEVRNMDYIVHLAGGAKIFISHREFNTISENLGASFHFEKSPKK